MPRLQTSKDPADWPTTDAILDALLAESGVAESLPTDESKVLDYLNLKQLRFDFTEDLDFGPISLPDAKRLRAALVPDDRLVVTQASLGAKQERFSILHEISHYVLPEHQKRLFLDTTDTLSWRTKVRLEKEANQFAADLIFQGARFTEESLERPLGCQSVIKLAPTYNASYESAIRRYVERHVQPCAVFVYQKSIEDEGTDLEDVRYRIHYSVTSPSFRKKFFSGVTTDEPFREDSEIFQVHGKIGKIVTTELEVNKSGDRSEVWRFETEIFTNGYKIFQLVTKTLKT